MILRRRQFIGALCAAVALVSAPMAAQAKDKSVTVFAAASLTEALNEIGDLYFKAGHAKPTFNFAGSSTLARQIEQGAPADLFFSADEPWMDYVAEKQLIDPATRASLLSNSLVLVAPADKPITIDVKPGFNLAGALQGGKLSLADPDSVPAGKYAKAALTSLGAWDALQPLIVRSDNVRSALRFVETGDAAAGIVYGTDAIASKKVKIAGTFPDSTHPKISYPVAVLKGPNAKAAKAFEKFLKSTQAKAVFEKRGFQMMTK